METITQSTTRATLSKHYKAIRQRLDNRHTPARPIIPIDRIRPGQAIGSDRIKPNRIMTRPAPAPLPEAPPKPNARQYVKILFDVATRYGVSVADLAGPSRSHRYVPARQEACYLLRQAGYSFPQIGGFLGGRDHTTVMHGAQKHEARLKLHAGAREILQAKLKGGKL